MTKVGMHAAKTRLSKLVARAEGGEEIVITRRGESAVRLVPARRAGAASRSPGPWDGRMTIGEDFDELFADLAEPFGIAR